MKIILSTKSRESKYCCFFSCWITVITCIKKNIAILWTVSVTWSKSRKKHSYSCSISCITTGMLNRPLLIKFQFMDIKVSDLQTLLLHNYYTLNNHFHFAIYKSFAILTLHVKRMLIYHVIVHFFLSFPQNFSIPFYPMACSTPSHTADSHGAAWLLILQANTKADSATPTLNTKKWQKWMEYSRKSVQWLLMRAHKFCLVLYQQLCSTTFLVLGNKTF